MLDIKFIRENKEWVEKRLQTRDPNISLDEIVELDKRRRKLKTEVDRIKAQRNKIQKQLNDLLRDYQKDEN